MKRLTLSAIFTHLWWLLLMCRGSALAQDLGPYKEIYPFADISQDQQSCSPDPARNVTCPLYVALMMSFGGNFESSGVIPGVQLAIEQINQNQSLLPGYTLHYILMDTQCDRTTALSALHTELLQPPTKIGIIGSGCSVATEPTAEVSRYHNLTHVSCASSSSELTNRTQFLYHFGILATEADLAFGFYSIIRHFQWSRVTILLQEENLFTVTMDQLTRLLRDSDVEVRERRFSSVRGVDGLDQPFDDQYRIYIVAMYSNNARRLMCEAYKQGIFYPKNLFLFYGWYVDQWWKEGENESLPCTAKQRERVVSSGLAPLQDEFISDCADTACSNITGYDFYRKTESLLKASTLDIPSLSMYAQQCYDATWTLAKALSNSITSINNNASLQQQLSEFNEGGQFDGLQHFTYNNSGFVNLLRDHLSDTNFKGISGSIMFNRSSGVRLVSTITVRQYRPSDTVECTRCTCDDVLSNDPTIRREEIGTVELSRPNILNLTFSGELFTNGIPFDGRPIPQVQSIHVSVTVVFVILSTAGITFAIVCMVFNFVFRERKLIRLTSPKLNYLIVAGAIILYVDIYFFVIPTTSKAAVTFFCNFTAWLTAIGYSLCYGTIVAKMFRVFYIFRNPTEKKRTLQDWHLALIVVMFVAIDVIILLVYIIYNAAQGTLGAVRIRNAENPTATIGELAKVFDYFFYFCDSKSRDICLGIIYGYKAVLQIVALVFSFSIRKVKVKGLNDAKGIAGAVYVTSIVTAVIIVAFYSLKGYLNLYAVLFCLGFFIGTTAILCLIFIPKMYSLYRDPKGENVFTHTTPSTPNGSSDKALKTASNRTVESLRNQVKELELALSKYEPGILKKPPTRVSFDESGSIKYPLSSNDVATPTTMEEGSELHVNSTPL